MADNGNPKYEIGQHMKDYFNVKEILDRIIHKMDSFAPNYENKSTGAEVEKLKELLRDAETKIDKLNRESH